MLGLTSEIAGAATALAGLILVFFGGVVNAYDRYTKEQRGSVRSKFQRRAWGSFIAFAAALLSAVFALLAKWLVITCLATMGFSLLMLSFLMVAILAFIEAREIN